MSTFSGQQHKGAMREHKARKRDEARARNAQNLAVVVACGHATSLSDAEHLTRCGGAR